MNPFEQSYNARRGRWPCLHPYHHHGVVVSMRIEVLSRGHYVIDDKCRDNGTWRAGSQSKSDIAVRIL
jgi:hypothetical protein